jgi:hypothetical protein
MSELRKEELYVLASIEQDIVAALCETVQVWIDETAENLYSGSDCEKVIQESGKLRELKAEVVKLRQGVAASLPEVTKLLWWNRDTSSETMWLKDSWWREVNTTLAVYADRLSTIFKQFDCACDLKRFEMPFRIREMLASDRNAVRRYQMKIRQCKDRVSREAQKSEQQRRANAKEDFRQA